MNERNKWLQQAKQTKQQFRWLTFDNCFDWLIGWLIDFNWLIDELVDLKLEKGHTITIGGNWDHLTCLLWLNESIDWFDWFGLVWWVRWNQPSISNQIWCYESISFIYLFIHSFSDDWLIDDGWNEIGLIRIDLIVNENEWLMEIESKSPSIEIWLNVG